MAIVLIVVALLCAGATVLVATSWWDVSMAESTAQLRVRRATARRAAAVALETAQARWAAPTALGIQDADDHSSNTSKDLVFDFQSVPPPPVAPAGRSRSTTPADRGQIPPGLAPTPPPPAPPTDLTAPDAVN